MDSESEKYVRCCFGERNVEVPLEDYCEIIAYQYGYNSYDDLKADGKTIELSENDIIERNEN